MKKYTLAFALLAILPVVSADAYQSNTRRHSSYYTGQSAKTSTYKTTKTTGKHGYRNTITNNIYYTQQPVQYVQQPRNDDYAPAARRYSYVENEPVYADNKKQVSRTEKYRSSQTRKYFLAHPFFQPLEGRFGSVTDLSYTTNSFNFDILNGSVLDIDPNSDAYNAIIAQGIAGLSGKQETSQFVVKEDFSYGISDSLAIVAMAQYDKTKVSFKDWSGGEPGDSTSDSGLNIFGIGLQNRFVDNDKWIAMIAGYFQHQKDTANTFIGELKAGYKIDRTTVYGLGRFGFSNLIEGDTYGAFVKAEDGDWLMLSYKTDVENVIYAEGGVGAFAVLNKYFTLNGELVLGHYDWHNQVNVKGAIGWQPGDSFALNLYASTSLYDSGKDKVNKYMNYDMNPVTTDFPAEAQNTTLVYTTGEYKIKDYNEWKIGVQAILYF